MVLRPEPAVQAIEQAKARHPNAKVLLFSPRGKPLKQTVARRFAQENKDLILLCPRYEGVDERIVDWVDEEISIGDYILMGGEVAAMVLVEAVARLLPGVLGNETSCMEESFESDLLEYPQYTKPREFEGRRVPDVLLSGDHREIQHWRKEQAIQQTLARRPDLLPKSEFRRGYEVNIALVHHPVLGPDKDRISSSITNIDVHDIARSARTFGVNSFYVTHPVKIMRRLTQKVLRHWEEGFGAALNPSRKAALELVRIVDTVEAAILDIENRTGILPRVVVTSAQDGQATALSFSSLRQILAQEQQPVLILFGTGWGLADEIMARADYRLEPVRGIDDYNHLSVRAAVAIILDRLYG